MQRKRARRSLSLVSEEDAASIFSEEDIATTPDTSSDESDESDESNVNIEIIPASKAPAHLKRPNGKGNLKRKAKEASTRVISNEDIVGAFNLSLGGNGAAPTRRQRQCVINERYALLTSREAGERPDVNEIKSAMISFRDMEPPPISLSELTRRRVPAYLFDQLHYDTEERTLLEHRCKERLVIRSPPSRKGEVELTEGITADGWTQLLLDEECELIPGAPDSHRQAMVNPVSSVSFEPIWTPSTPPRASTHDPEPTSIVEETVDPTLREGRMQEDPHTDTDMLMPSGPDEMHLDEQEVTSPTPSPELATPEPPTPPPPALSIIQQPLIHVYDPLPCPIRVQDSDDEDDGFEVTNVIKKPVIARPVPPAPIHPNPAHMVRPKWYKGRWSIDIDDDDSD